MSKLRDALRKKFKTPREAIVALGLDESILTERAYDSVNPLIKEKTMKTIKLSALGTVAYGSLMTFLRPQLAINSDHRSQARPAQHHREELQGEASNACRVDQRERQGQARSGICAGRRAEYRRPRCRARHDRARLRRFPRGHEGRTRKGKRRRRSRATRSATKIPIWPTMKTRTRRGKSELA